LTGALPGIPLCSMVACSDSTRPFGGLLTLDGQLLRVLEEARRASALDVGVLVTGETGTGKELVARAIHASSRRMAAPFVAVDCAALPRTTLESELFGHRRGAFSGAERDRIGRIEAARGGTVFLDSVDELDLEAQAGLLRVIEEKEVVPLGESRPRGVDFRLLASSAPALRRKVEEGIFRADLFYRIKVVEIELPPLRERRVDIPLLAERFLQHSARSFGKPVQGFTAQAMEVLTRFDWPGNVRELLNAVEAAAAAARGERVQESDLPVHVRVPRRPRAAEPEPSPPSPAEKGGEDRASGFAEQVEGFQRGLILKALGRSLWSHRDAARELGLERHQLKYLCAKLGIRRSAAS